MGADNYKYGDPYKFKAIYFYSSPEWMAHSQRKYRRVFDKAELSYLRSEFVFYNKLFDEEDWEAKVSVKFIEKKRGKKKEITTLDEDIKISKNENTVHVYKSWGVKEPGGFWEKGDYLCEAYIDDKLVGSAEFHIEDVGLVSSDNNPYFDIESIKLYSGDSKAWEKKDKRYLTAFNKEKTQYVWLEINIKNKTQKDWNFEFLINIYDDAGQLKAQMDSLYYVEAKTKGDIFTYNRGWGSNEAGTWKDDKYVAELVFMDNLIASIPFDMGEEDIEGLVEVKNTQHSSLLETVSKVEEEEKTLEELQAELDGLIGLEKIKTQIKEHVAYIEFLKLRKEKGLKDEEKITLHSVFTGNPGTGKTTVVKQLAKIYSKMGLLSNGHLHEVDRADLVGEFIGQTAPKVKKAIEKARGGVLFIDEAYSLARANEDSKDYGREVIEILLKEMSDGPGDIAIMVAGYPKEMEDFINSNPGLKSRFKYYFHFEDYTPDELIDIAQYAADKRSVIISEDAKEYINKLMIDAYRDRDKSFGNARFAYSVIDEGKMNMGLRLIKDPNVNNMSDEELSTIQLSDVQKITAGKKRKKINIPIDEDLLKIAIAELSSLIGMEQLKAEVNDMIKLVRYYRETGKDVLNKFSLHTIYTGNPGTGKTTVARIMGKVYKALGLLERGHVVETGREGLIAGFIGQTALKTKEKIQEAMGGILFIDEAYALSDGGSKNSYGQEAIEVILKNMEDHRGKFAIIAAGYPDNMNEFLMSNPGLKSRFDRLWHFYDYSADTLMKIAQLMFREENLFLDKKAEQFLLNYLKQLYEQRDKFFGNARSVRKIVEQAVKNQNLRMASIAPEDRSEEAMKTLIISDFREIDVEAGTKNEQKRMGFR